MSLDKHYGAKNVLELLLKDCRELRKLYVRTGYSTNTIDTMINYCKVYVLYADKAIGDIYKKMHDESQEVEKIRESNKDESERV
tara:strand:- start:473 stop:724 length:252 start_codon:yes stop_codon:yes gene_type:complete